MKKSVLLFSLLAAITLGSWGAFVGVVGSDTELTECHDNLTCDSGKTCHSMDGGYVCIGSVKSVDTRRNICFSLMDTEHCFTTQAECLQSRAALSTHYTSVGSCDHKSYVSKPGPRQNE